MWNVVDNFDVECSRERLRRIWWITLTWNDLENGDVECGGERLMWNVVGNGGMEYGG